MEYTLKSLIAELFSVDLTPQITRPDPQFGDYATNVALQLAGKLGQSPRDIATKLADALRDTGEFADVSVAGPGFINLRLSDAALLKQVASMDDTYGTSHLYDGKVVITEYSDPNPFKVLHAGHLYTSIIGHVMSNLIEAAGGTVSRVNFGGDVGLHVAKTIWAAQKQLDGDIDQLLTTIPEEGRADWLAARYVEGTNAYEDDETAKQAIIDLNKIIYGLHESGDTSSDVARIYWTGRRWSYDYFTAFYDRIGTPFDRFYPESETAPAGLAAVLEQKDRGVYSDSDGAVVFVGEPYGLHTRVFVNNQGLPTYEAKDVGLSLKKWDDYHFDESIIITGNDITEYMKVVLKSIEQFAPDLAQRTRHVTHGNVKLQGGVKMSSRKGNFLKAIDVIDIANDALQEAQPGADESVVLGAIKYAFLKNRVGPDVIFDPKESVALHGNSGPYLQYAYARASTLLTKATVQPGVTENDTLDEAERSLAVKLTEFPEVVEAATRELSPHLMCTYVYELTQVFNRFYESSRIVDDPREALRLELVHAYRLLLGKSLALMGIAAPESL